MKVAKKTLVLLLIVGLVTPLFLQFASFDAQGANEYSDEDIAKAETIANETGYSVDHILTLRGQGMDWNSVINFITAHKREGGQAIESTTDNDQLLGQLLEMGYTKEQIEEAQDMVEWIGYKIEEIETLSDEEIYKDLKEKFNRIEAIYFVVQLEDIKGSITLALNEYLIALQLELDLNLLLEDEEAYEQRKTEKTITYQKELITTQDMDEKLMDLLSNGQDDEDDKEVEDFTQENKKEEVSDPKDMLPDRNEKIEVEDVKPVNPAKAIQDEIEALTSFGDE